MEQSEQINDLAGALAKAQAEIKDAVKDTKGHGYMYATLSGILELTRPVLSKHGLSVVQAVDGQDGAVSVTTQLQHSSGQWLRAQLSLAIEPGRRMGQAQAAGAVITYARRYALASMVGIAQTDTDAHQEPETEYVGSDQVNMIRSILASMGRSEELFMAYLQEKQHFKGKTLEDITVKQFVPILEILKKNQPKEENHA